MPDLFNRAFAPYFRLSPRLLEQISPTHRFVHEEGGDPVGFLWAKAGPAQVWIDALGVLPAWRRRGIGTRLVQRALALAEGRPVRLGGGPAHLFPGLPQELAEHRPFFEKLHFQEQPGQLDLILPPDRAPAPARHDRLRFLPCPPERAAELQAFVEREFPGRWAVDTARRLSLEPPTGVVIGVTAENELAAFCHTWRESSAMVGPSLNWTEGLHNPGGIGPVGVGAAHRGGGAGLALTLASLHQLREGGAGHIVVDWTTLENFYRRAGFEPFRRYTPYQTGGSASN